MYNCGQLFEKYGLGTVWLPVISTWCLPYCQRHKNILLCEEVRNVMKKTSNNFKVVILLIVHAVERTENNLHTFLTFFTF